MKTRQVTLPDIKISLEIRPFEVLERWMLAKSEVCRLMGNQAELNTEEVEDEIVSVWILMFRSVEALNTALCVLMDKYEDDVLSDFCRYYALVLNEMRIEVRR
jgi:hypothetical protein